MPLIATAHGGHLVELTWSVPTSEQALAWYQVSRDGAPLKRVPAMVMTQLSSKAPLTFMTDLTVQPGQRYAYSVVAIDVLGGASTPASASVTMPAAEPSPLTDALLPDASVPVLPQTIAGHDTAFRSRATGQIVVRLANGTLVALSPSPPAVVSWWCATPAAIFLLSVATSGTTRGPAELRTYGLDGHLMAHASFGDADTLAQAIYPLANGAVIVWTKQWEADANNNYVNTWIYRQGEAQTTGTVLVPKLGGISIQWTRIVEHPGGGLFIFMKNDAAGGVSCVRATDTGAGLTITSIDGRFLSGYTVPTAVPDVEYTQPLAVVRDLGRQRLVVAYQIRNNYVIIPAVEPGSLRQRIAATAIVAIDAAGGRTLLGRTPRYAWSEPYQRVALGIDAAGAYWLAGGPLNWPTMRPDVFTVQRLLNGAWSPPVMLGRLASIATGQGVLNYVDNDLDAFRLTQWLDDGQLHVFSAGTGS